MEKFDLNQTFLTSFIVAFVLEVISYFKSTLLNGFNSIYHDEFVGNGFWFLGILLSGSILGFVISEFPYLLNINDKNLISDIKRYSIRTFLIAFILLIISSGIFAFTSHSRL